MDCDGSSGLFDPAQNRGAIARRKARLRGCLSQLAEVLEHRLSSLLGAEDGRELAQNIRHPDQDGWDILSGLPDPIEGGVGETLHV
jgi:hypothetical protein